jgi:hypothetical protein
MIPLARVSRLRLDGSRAGWGTHDATSGIVTSLGVAHVLAVGSITYVITYFMIEDVLTFVK